MGESLYVLDAASSTLRSIRIPDTRVATLVNGGLFSDGANDGPGMAARMRHPSAMHADLARGVLWIADTLNHKSRVYSIAKGELKTLNVNYRLQSPAGDLRGTAGSLDCQYRCPRDPEAGSEDGPAVAASDHDLISDFQRVAMRKEPETEAVGFDGRAFARTLTSEPGVYRMLGLSDQVLYVERRAVCVPAWRAILRAGRMMPGSPAWSCRCGGSK